MPSTTPTIYLYFSDPSFFHETTDAAKSFYPADGSACIGRLSRHSATYFSTPMFITDKRVERHRLLPFTPKDESVHLIYDSAASVFDYFGEDFMASDQTVQQAVFSLIERTLFVEGPMSDADLRGILQDVPYPGCVTSTLIRSPVRVLDHAADEANTLVGAHTWVQFDAELHGSLYTLKTWVEDGAFHEDYPTTIVDAVIPPMNLSRLLTVPPAASSTSLYTASRDTLELAIATLRQPPFKTTPTGVAGFYADVIDENNSATPTVFGVTYHGREPDRITSRLSVRQTLLSSGIGTEAQWRARLPSCFIDGRFYIIPLWNHTTTRIDQQIYPSPVPVRKQLATARAVLTNSDGNFIDTYAESLSATYDAMPLVAVPHVDNENGLFSLLTAHPTYQPYQTTDPNYQYMTEATRSFARQLNEALAYAAGEGTTNRPVINEDGLLYYVFDVGHTEFCVITKECVLDRAGGV